ncbi:MAG: hypothetical protein WDM92_12605 [Caulobacteraceae bacterium]
MKVITGCLLGIAGVALAAWSTPPRAPTTSPPPPSTAPSPMT